MTQQNQYKCDLCHEQYEKGRSEEEAKQEAMFFFGEQIGKAIDAKDPSVSVVCDTCYQKIMMTR